jgi:hypothetical protein
VIEQALETAGLMLGTNKSRGYCLEMICADFLAGASQDNNEDALLLSINRMFQLLPQGMKMSFLEGLQKGFVTSLRPRRPPATGSRSVRRNSKTGARAGRLEMPELRKLSEPSGTPPQSQKSTRGRFSRKSHYALCRLPSGGPRHSSLTIAIYREGGLTMKAGENSNPRCASFRHAGDA